MGFTHWQSFVSAEKNRLLHTYVRVLYAPQNVQWKTWSKLPQMLLMLLSIPVNMLQKILSCIYCGHKWIPKCQEQTKKSMWCLRNSNEREEMANRCLVCFPQASDHYEPSLLTEFYGAMEKNNPRIRVLLPILWICHAPKGQWQWFIIVKPYLPDMAQILLFSKLHQSRPIESVWSESKKFHWFKEA